MKKTKSQKDELHQWIDSIEEEWLIRALYSVKDSNQDGDWWDDLSKSAKDSVDRGLAQSDAGKGMTSREMWADLDRRIKTRRQ